MKLIKPQVQLKRERTPGLPDTFYLHSVTFFDKTNFSANGNGPVPTELDTESLWNIELEVTEDDNSIAHDYLTPVVHTFQLGNSPFGTGDGLLNISVYTTDSTSVRKKAGDVIVSTADADEDSRPIGQNS